MLTILSASTIWMVISLAVGFTLILLRGRLNPSLYEYFELGRWGVFPYFALLAGHISPRFIGFTNADWRTTFGMGLGLGFGLLTLAAITKITSHRTATGPFTSHTSSISLHPEKKDTPFSLGQWCWWILRGSIQEFHWIFFRAAVWETFLSFPNSIELPAYTGIWIAGIIALIEIMVHGRGRNQLIGQSATLLLTSVLFLYTRNLYLCCLLHAGMVMLLPQAFLAPAAAHQLTPRVDTQFQSFLQK